MASASALALAGPLGLNAKPAFGAAATVPTTSIATLTTDDEGRALFYPYTLFLDAKEGELFLVNGGRNGIVVYGPDLFPFASLGAGRGVDAPRGLFVAPNGFVYLCQGKKGTKPARITVLNPAFFAVREIPLDGIPGAKNFVPRKIAVNRNGIIYVAGEASLGVLVLDEEGSFLRWVQPIDQKLWQEKKEEAGQPSPKGSAEGSAPAKPTGESPPQKEAPKADIPAEFRPRSAPTKDGGQAGPGVGPVRIRAVNIDSEGKLYLLSHETGKVYVYSPEEAFLYSFGEKGGTSRKVSTPSALAIDETRKLIYIVDYMRHTVLAYDMAGTFQFEFGGRGYAPGWFNFPTDIAINSRGHVVVVDRFNHRVQILEVRPRSDLSSALERSDPSPPAAGADAGQAEGTKQEEEPPEPPEPGSEDGESGEGGSGAPTTGP